MRQLKWQINRRSLLHRQSIYPLILFTFFQLRQLHVRERQLPEGGGGQWVQEADRTRAAALTLLHSPMAQHWLHVPPTSKGWRLPSLTSFPAAGRGSIWGRIFLRYAPCTHSCKSRCCMLLQRRPCLSHYLSAPGRLRNLNEAANALGRPLATRQAME